MLPGLRTSCRLGTALAVSLAAALSVAPARGAQATLTWDPDPDPDVRGYRIYYDRDSGAPYAGTDAAEGPSPLDVPITSLTDPTHPSLAVTELDSCVRYYFALQVYYLTGESTLSPEASAVLVAAPAPVTVGATGARSLRVSWPGPPPGDEGTIPTYRVHYDTDSGDPYGGADAAQGPSPLEVQTAGLFDPLHPTQDLSQLREEQVYYVAVESVCDDGTGKLSAEESGTTAVPADAGAPPWDDDGGPPVDGPGPAADAGPVHINARSCECRAPAGAGCPARGVAWLLVAGVLARARRRRRR